MTNGDVDDPRAEIAGLRTQIGMLQRSLQQTERVAATSEAMAERSKRAMLRTHEELQRRVEELRTAKVAAEEAVEAKGRFLATMSHELRTPLNGMVGSAELLLATRLDDDQLALVDLLHRSATSLLTIVNDVLDYSRAEAGRLQLEDAPFRLAECIGGVVELQRQVAAEKGLELLVHVDPHVPIAVRGDPGRLRQVLMNLVSNAVKFTSRGAVAVSVARGAAADELVFAVRDTGIGIKPEAQARLFEAFVQEDASTTRRFGGTGLGLVICKQLVERMGGTIAVDSEPGVGTTFRFTCRLPAVDAALAGPDLGRPNAGAAAPGSGRGTVLIVDDNAGNRMLVRKMLERLGCSGVEVGDGASAVAAAQNGRFDLILMDCGMPIMDGYAATRAIRQLGADKPHVPIVALTAYAMPEDEARCLQAGMDDYLSKPLRMQQLTGVVDRYLGRRP